MRDLAVLFLHLLATVARLAGLGGARSVVAESVLVKHQLLILNRSRKRSPNLRLSDRIVAGLCALFMRPRRLIRSAIVLKRKYKRFRRRERASTHWLGRIARRDPRLFVLWQLGVKPEAGL